MSNWEKLDSASKSIAHESWNLYWREFDVKSDDFQKILMDPLEIMCTELAEVERDWRVQSNVIGHEIGLTRGVACGVTLVDPRAKTVFLTFYKHD